MTKGRWYIKDDIKFSERIVYLMWKQLEKIGLDSLI